MHARRFLLCLAAAALAPAAASAYDAPPPRAALGLHVGFGSFDGGAWSRVASVWGYGNFGPVTVFALEGGAFVTPWLMVGGRLGTMQVGDATARADGASLSVASYDLGLVARAGATLGQRYVRFFVGGQVEAGGAFAVTTLRDQAQTSLVPRFAARAVGQVLVGRLAFFLTVGQRFSWWGNADGQGSTLELGGTEATTGLEVRL